MTDDRPDVPDGRVAVDRTAVRVLPINDRGEVLLLQGFEPTRPDQLFWFSVGGGLETGEDDRQAAVREMAEETGITTPPQSLLGPFIRETAEFSWGNYDVTQHQTWWAVKVGDPRVSFAGLDEIEQSTTVGHRWWTPDELATAGQTYAPGLVEQMRTALQLASERDIDVPD